ncbi:hypothetical protein [Mucilaginibacter sp. RCC_168]|uniref:hypothetical protein n=1 Tax=Mucilaginibacter sp. RCC_168 TaxID=3239221 RepID=UPI003524ABE7
MKVAGVIIIALCLIGCKASSYKRYERKALDSVKHLNAQGRVTDSLYTKGYKEIK